MSEWKTYAVASAAGLLTVSQIVLGFFLYSESGTPWLRYVGWAVVAVAFVLGFMGPSRLRQKGGVATGKSYVHTSVLVESGIYTVVRHPQSGLSWILLLLAPILIAQHWILVVIGIPAMVLVYISTRQEDRYLVEKFGPAYETYMQRVPSVNFVAGLMRLLSRRNSP